MIKEMNYYHARQEEAEEDRFRRLDAAIVGNIRKRTNRKKNSGEKEKAVTSVTSTLSWSSSLISL